MASCGLRVFGRPNTSDGRDDSSSFLRAASSFLSYTTTGLVFFLALPFVSFPAVANRSKVLVLTPRNSAASFFSMIL